MAQILHADLVPRAECYLKARRRMSSGTGTARGGQFQICALRALARTLG